MDDAAAVAGSAGAGMMGSGMSNSFATGPERCLRASPRLGMREDVHITPGRDCGVTVGRDAAGPGGGHHRGMSRIDRWAEALAGAGASIVALVLLVAGGATDGSSVVDGVTTVVGVAAGGVLGALVLDRAHGPERRIGWVLLATAVLGGVTAVASSWARLSARDPAHPGPGTQAALLVDRASWLVAMAGFALLLTVFPTGRVPSPRWRPLPIAEAVVFPLAWIGVTFLHKPLTPPLDVFPPTSPRPGSVGRPGTPSPERL